ncbi:MAG: type II toxin-antitoxin system RelE/ParE family toxin [Candidatus Lambdaproteobacteria bacterium]|nr:type II toxin-antitoxin system RelE/ParE family toxin [Candidatus Lambdaproteobacteria bacterium]
MIASFGNRDTQRLAAGEPVPRWRSIAAPARRKLYMLHLATHVSDLSIPPCNRLEKLHGDRDGQWSIRINERWRICFEWRGDCAYDVEIVDYHR